MPNDLDLRVRPNTGSPGALRSTKHRPLMRGGLCLAHARL